MIFMILITVRLEPINCDEEDTCINVWIGVPSALILSLQEAL